MGKAFLKGENGDHVLKMVQQLVPEMKMQLVAACRGTGRQRIQPTEAGFETPPWRKTVVVSRDSGEVVDLGPP